VAELATGAGGSNGSNITAQPKVTIQIPTEWTKLCTENPVQAKQEQLRVRHEFQEAFAAGLIAAAFARSAEQPRYLLYEKGIL
jgi:predicted GNAT superfamily acetyltransferase